VQSDDPTLVESADEALLRASFAIGPNYASLLRSNLHAVLARHRVLALRGAVRQSLLASDDWLAALLDLDVTVRREALAQVAYVEMNDVGILEEIVILLDDPDPLVVDAAVFALGEHFYANAVEKLSNVATNHDDTAPVRRRAIVALSNFEGPDIEAALERASEDRDWQVRAAVDQLKTDQD
jgi:HEAT repeat protein